MVMEYKLQCSCFMWAKIVKIWSKYFKLLILCSSNFVARWYYETLKQAYVIEIKKENI